MVLGALIVLVKPFVAVQGKGLILIKDGIIVAVSMGLFYLLGVLLKLAYLKDSANRIWKRLARR